MNATQLQALRTAIDANGVWAAFPLTDDGHYALAAELNLTAAPDFLLWRTETPVEAIIDGIDGAKYTPVDSMPVADAATGNAAIHQFNGRLLAIQTKQMNLQSLLLGRTVLNCSRANVRAWLRDAVIQVPAGVAGANVNPGGTNANAVMTLCTRKATYGEKILAGAQETTGGVTASVIGYEGSISPQDVQQARSL